MPPVNIEKPIEETDDEHWDLHLAVVLKASFFTVQAALPLLRESRGCVINIASELGLHAIANNVAYVAAKHGVVAMTRAMAIELAGDGRPGERALPGHDGHRADARMRRRERRSGGLLPRLRGAIIRSAGWPRPRRSRTSSSASPRRPPPS